MHNYYFFLYNIEHILLQLYMKNIKTITLRNTLDIGNITLVKIIQSNTTTIIQWWKD